jgi:hypothetical protein
VPFSQVTGVVNSFALNPWIVIKILLLIGLLFYIVFAIIIVRQVKLMSQVLTGLFEGVIDFIAWVHLLVAVLIFIAALAII